MEPSSAFEAGQAAGRILVYAVIGLAALGGGVFFIIALIKALTRKTRGWIIGTIVSGVLAFSGVVGLVGVAANSIAKLAKTAGEKKKTLVSNDGRLQIQVPGTWRSMPELHEEAQLKAGNARQEQYVLVIENLRSDFHGTAAEFDDLLTLQMRDSIPGLEVSEREVRPVGPYPATHRRLVGDVDKIRIVYHVASIETDAAFYQVMTWTSPSREAAAAPVFREIIDSFKSTDGPPGAGTARSATTAGAGIHDRVAAIVMGQLGTQLDAVKPDARFVEDLGADSLDTVELVMAVEEEFEVSISDEVAGKLRTVGELVHWLEEAPQVEVE